MEGDGRENENNQVMHTEITHKSFRFKQPAGTSRGVYTVRNVQYVTIIDDEDSTHRGVGECAPLPDLSNDESAMLFAFETAMLEYERRSKILFDTPFGRGEEGIPINGLIWMGTYEEMKARIEEKLRLGFRCVKLKIGAINFDDEVALLKMIRSRFPREVIELRVDANGAFKPSDDARRKLDTLAALDLHSIEQPIRQGQWEEMGKLCAETPLPIALDEELIGICKGYEGDRSLYKQELLDAIRPQYIILKPSLHGGMAGSEQWINLARERGIGSWITSALETNVGLNSIAHFAAKMYGPNIQMPQGLGTGQLFVDNVDGYPIHLKGDEIWCE